MCVRRIQRCLVTCLAGVLVLGVMSGCATVRRTAARPSAVTTIPASNLGAEKDVLSAVNKLRASRGLRPLRVHPALTNKARYWALWMSAGNCGRGGGGVPTICHSNLAAGIRIPWSWLAENVGAASPRTNHNGVSAGFKNSPRHAANILSTRAKYVGIGVAYAGNTVYVVEEFMAP